VEGLDGLAPQKEPRLSEDLDRRTALVAVGIVVDRSAAPEFAAPLRAVVCLFIAVLNAAAGSGSGGPCPALCLLMADAAVEAAIGQAR